LPGCLQGLVFAIGTDSGILKLYDVRSYDAGPFATFVVSQRFASPASHTQICQWLDFSRLGLARFHALFFQALNIPIPHAEIGFVWLSEPGLIWPDFILYLAFPAETTPAGLRAGHVSVKHMPQNVSDATSILRLC
jgi:hypothetical protein